MTASELYFHLKKIFEQNNLDSPQFEAMCIAEHIFAMKLNKIFLEKKTVTQEQKASADLISYRRIQGEPLQYLLGKWEFYGLDFFVGEGVLIPRQDTETLVDKALSLKLPECPKIIDLCSGSGCIAIAVSKNIVEADVTAVEISERAVKYINKNMCLNNADIKIVMGDATEKSTAEQFSDIDLILCNPPYLTSGDMQKLQKEVKFEPKEALFGGEDGLDFYRNITAVWKNTLKPNGILAYEIGIGQEQQIINILENNNFYNIQTADDLCGITRVVLGSKRQEENSWLKQEKK